MRTFDLYKPVAEAISLLLFPDAEVVLHDLSTNTIAAIYNPYSKRKAGDESLLDDNGKLPEGRDAIPPYFKTLWDGRKVKSVSAILRDAEKKPIGLLCINLDVSKWEQMNHFIQHLIAPADGERPEILFKNDWREKINQFVSSYLGKHALRFEKLDREDKRKLLQALLKEGAFKSKNAASYIADVLQISRATVYNYLKDTRHGTSSL